MSCKEWGDFLLSNVISEEIDLGNGVKETKLIPCRVELLYPDNCWTRTWTLARMKGLESVCTTFLWRLLHDLLPSRQRLFRLKLPNIINDKCAVCDTDTTDTTSHALTKCFDSRPVLDWLLERLQRLTFDLTAEKVLLIDISLRQPLPHNELALVWLLSLIHI